MDAGGCGTQLLDLESGCISKTLSLIKKIQLDGLYLEEELLSFFNKVHFV